MRLSQSRWRDVALQNRGGGNDHARTEAIIHAQVARVRGLDLTLSFPFLQDVALCLYRVAQASLANVANHSGAKIASVVLVSAADNIQLAVSDDGVGFDPAAVSAQYGLGLVSMRERLRLVGGHLSINARPKGGTRIEATVPLTSKPV